MRLTVVGGPRGAGVWTCWLPSATRGGCRRVERVPCLIPSCDRPLLPSFNRSRSRLGTFSQEKTTEGLAGQGGLAALPVFSCSLWCVFCKHLLVRKTLCTKFRSESSIFTPVGARYEGQVQRTCGWCEPGGQGGHRDLSGREGTAETVARLHRHLRIT